VARHLAKLGHRCLGFVGGRQETSTNTQRLAGFRQALTELGIDLPSEHVVHGAFTYDSGYASARRFPIARPRCSAPTT
jgi:LacI family transcriptional regulator